MWIVIRMLGAFCIMSACILTGMSMEYRIKKRWQILQEMQEILTFLEKEMTYHRSPVQEAFRNAAGKCETEFSQVLLAAVVQIEKREGWAFSKVWENAVNQHIPEKLFSENELRTIKETAAALCNTDTVMQKALLEKYADRFRMMSIKEAEVCREKGGLYRKLAAAAGVFLLIVLL